VTLFYLVEKPPYNVALHNRAHDFDSTERAEATARGISFFGVHRKGIQRVVNTVDSVMARRKSQAG
jgi:hypothetical protein